MDKIEEMWEKYCTSADFTTVEAMNKMQFCQAVTELLKLQREACVEAYEEHAGFEYTTHEMKNFILEAKI